MNLSNIKRSIVLNGQKTSVSLEQEIWDGLREIADLQDTKLARLLFQIDQGRDGRQADVADDLTDFLNQRVRDYCIGMSRVSSS